MSNIQKSNFFDCNVSVGSRTIPLKNQIYNREALLGRLNECGIYEALVYHLSSVENCPTVGNKRLMEEIADVDCFHAAWAGLPFGVNEMGTPAELRTELKRCNIKGMLLYSGSQSFSLGEWNCSDLYEILESMHMPVFIRMNEDITWDGLAELLANHPGIPVIFRNTGYQADRRAYRLLEKFNNFYIETANYVVFNGIEEITRHFGSRRLIFGSGAPYLSPGSAVTAVLMSDLSIDDKKQIAGGNYRELMGRIDYNA